MAENTNSLRKPYSAYKDFWNDTKPFKFKVTNSETGEVRIFSDRFANREEAQDYVNRYNAHNKPGSDVNKTIELVEKIIKKSDGYYVQSEDGKKNLGGPYKKIEDAERRLGQVEYFKNKDKKNESAKDTTKATEAELWQACTQIYHNLNGFKPFTWDEFKQILHNQYGIDATESEIKKALRIADDEVNEILKENGIEPIHRQGGDKTLRELGLRESVLRRGVDSSKEFSYNKSGKRGKVMVNESLIADKVEDMASADDVKVALEAEYADYPHVLEGLLEWIGDGEDFEEYKENLVNLLNEIEYLESTDQMDALEMATEDQGSSYFEDTVDIINRGDFIFFPGVEDDEELGHAFVDMCGGISAAVSQDRLATYIDIDEVAETFKEGTEDDPDLADMDDDAWYNLAEEQVEMSPESYEDYFDYDQYGRDLRMEGGYFFGDLGAIAIL